MDEIDDLVNARVTVHDGAEPGEFYAILWDARQLSFVTLLGLPHRGGAEDAATRARTIIADMIRTAVEADRQRVSGAVRGCVAKMRAAVAEHCGSMTWRQFCDQYGCRDVEEYADEIERALALLDGDGGRAEKVERVVEER